NRKWYEYTGLPGGVISGPELQAVLHGEDAPRMRKAWEEAVAAGTVYEAEVRLRRGSDGAWRWFIDRGLPARDAAGAVSGWHGTLTDIHDQRMAAETARRNEERLATALAVADMGTFDWDMRSDAMTLDARSRQLFGFSPEQAVTGADVYKRIDPAAVRKVQQAFTAAHRDRKRLEIEYGVRHPDGKTRTVLSISHTADGADGRPERLYGVFADITRRKQVEEELAFQRHQLELIFRESPAAMALWRGENLIFERVNPQYQAWFGDRTLVGRSLTEAVPELAGQGFDDLLRKVLRTGEPFTGTEMPAQFAGGKNGGTGDRYFDFTYLQVRDTAGQPYGVYDHAVDVTSRVLARRALENSQTLLRQALSERQSLLDAERSARMDAEQTSRMKDEFLATLSHELRTPLNAILGWTEILAMIPDPPEDLVEGLEVITRNAHAQTQIIEDILDMSRIISGKLHLDIQPIDLPAIVRAAAETLQPAADAKGVELQILTAPLTGHPGGDSSRLQQVFWNLISNAVKFTPRGGKVRIALLETHRQAEVRVTDTGEGITPEFMPHIFGRFLQADSSTTRVHRGLGIGLSIVKQIVELHGGTVRVQSAGKGRGATFIVALPLGSAAPAGDRSPADSHPHHPSAAPPAPVRHAGAYSLKGVSVVAVDDEPDAVAFLQRLLTASGATVRTATSAAEALALIRAEPPSVLVSDIGMPFEDGYSLVRRLRALPPEEGGQVPAVALTAYAREIDRDKALESGFQQHIPKPVNIAQLIASITVLVKMRDSE
ncbi:MAG: hybrid sensor histidine kinase/response regulator, partial [Verrucomicrobiaceae bacterium]